MTDTRKHLRIAIPDDMAEDFEKAKREAEDSLRVRLTDSGYAAMLIRWAIDRQNQSQTY